MKLAFTVPGFPVPKARARVQIRAGKVRSFTPDATTEFEARVRWGARMAVASQGGWPVNAKAYRLTCRFYRPKGGRGDIDNYVKAVADALNPKRGATEQTRLVWIDDCRVRSLTAEIETDDENPRTEVEVEVIENADR